MVLTVAAAAIFCAVFFCNRGLLVSAAAGLALGENKPYRTIRSCRVASWIWISTALIFSAAAGFVVGRG